MTFGIILCYSAHEQHTETPAKRVGEEVPAQRGKTVRLTLNPNAGPFAAVTPVSKVVKLSTTGVDNSPEAWADRTNRFEDPAVPKSTRVSLKNTGGPPAPAPKTQLGLCGARAGSMRGTSTSLERPYLRLHFIPEASSVLALALVKKKWVANADYVHASEQLMTIQQDCKLQGVAGPLICDAYETQIRIALERADLGEFSRCLSALQEIYHAASVKKGVQASPNKAEFVSYRMLYGMIQERDVLENVTLGLRSISLETREHEDVIFASNVGKALVSNDYCSFFRLYTKAPKMAGFVMDFFVDRVRLSALQTYVKSMGPEITIDDLKALLCFEKRKEAFRFARDNRCVISADKRSIDCKASAGLV
ncbi:SAC3/GANP/Nin1/mts3/eIF-3 p25 family-domain-containing protein [Baffinella frigidus]|nr:SAC3/GANP/Nin1/mts3/eIF-3 p25 family-domain-containing protein [Cryptophyta sp. CCMP2293]